MTRPHIWLVCTLSAALGAHVIPCAAAQRAADSPARYVRIALPGASRILQLAEVWVVAGGQNVAPEGAASQSSTFGDSAAGRAIDGGVHGSHPAGSVTHTVEGPDPWWELDLGRDVVVDQVTVFNRTDCCGERLEGFHLALLDGARNVVWEAVQIPAPNPRYDVAPFGATIVTPPPTLVEKRNLQPAIDKAIDRGAAYLRATQLVDGSWGQHEHVHFGGQTALSVLTLLKAGAPVDDPAITAGLAFLRANGSESTYGTGCLLMALEAIGDAAAREWAAELADQLVSTQGGEDASGKQPGMWTYPLRPNSTVCLSNTQYAILGLRAAQHLGVEVPARVFEKTLENLPKYRGDIERVKALGGSDTRGAPTAGFMYRAEGGHGGTSGSMTTAALAIFHVCRESLGAALTRRTAAEVAELELAAWRWLELNFAIEQNPGRGGDFHYYYLYGMERVGAFFERPAVGGRDWYWEGARYLVAQQQGEGQWRDQTDTCFAVLFLKRATATVSGPSKRNASEIHVAEGDAAEVRWRGTGRAQGTFWLSGFGRALVDRLGGEAALRVHRVEYFVDGEAVAALPGDVTRPWRPGDRYATQLDLASRGKGQHEVRIRVQLVDPAPLAESTGYLSLEGAPLVVDVPASSGTAGAAQSHAAQNLLAKNRIAEVTASSSNSDGQSAAHAVDGLQGSAWLSKKEDAQPTLTFELERPVRAHRLVLSSANTELRNARAHDRATVIEVRINRDSDVLRFELEPDDRKKSFVELPPGKQLRRLEIRVVERVAGERWPGHVGFAEVELLADEQRKARR
jgi:hypothetical protein